MNPKILIGRDLERSADIRVPLLRLLKHAHVVGGTGCGKTGLLVGIIAKLRAHAPWVPLTFLDFKGEGAELLINPILPALSEIHPHISRENTTVIQACGRYGVPSNPLSPNGLPPAVQARSFARILSRLTVQVGHRMEGIITKCARAIIHIGGSPLDLRRLLVDQDFREMIAAKVPADLAHYLTHEFSGEPAKSVDSCRATLDMLLDLPQVRASICANSCVDGRQMLEAPLTIVSLGQGAPGTEAITRFYGQLHAQNLIAGIFSRPHASNQPQALIIIDEVQEAGSLLDELDRVLSLARSRNVAIWVAHQFGEQLPSSTRRSLLQNTEMQLRFRPNADDLAGLHALLPITGNRRDPNHPDKILSEARERELYLKSLERLRPREALIAFRSVGRATVMRTANVPFAELSRRASAVPLHVREGFQRGRLGVTFAELERMSCTHDLTASSSQVPTAPRDNSSRKNKRERLNLDFDWGQP